MFDYVRVPSAERAGMVRKGAKELLCKPSFPVARSPWIIVIFSFGWMLFSVSVQGRVCHTEGGKTYLRLRFPSPRPESELSLCFSKEFRTRCSVPRRQRVTLWFAFHYTPWLTPWKAFAKWWLGFCENTLKLSLLPTPCPYERSAWKTVPILKFLFLEHSC